MGVKHEKVMVTGADGFIGSHLTEALVGRGYNVRALVMYNSFDSWGWLDHVSDDTRKSIEVVAGDVRDHLSLRTAMEGCEAVAHLAALIAIPASYRAPQSYVDTNITGTLNVVQAARELSMAKVVHTSTSEVYGTAQYVPIDEKHPIHGQSPYAASKIGADQIALSYHRSFGTPVTVVRPFNTFGPRQSTRAVIPTIITQIASGNRRLELGALHPTRDFSFVTDTVSGFVSALESEAGTGEVVNIGSGFEVSIDNTALAIADLMNVEVEITCAADRMRPEKSEVERLFCDYSMASRLWGWGPDYGGLEGFRRGLRKAIDWFTQPDNLSLYKPDRFTI